MNKSPWLPRDSKSLDELINHFLIKEPHYSAGKICDNIVLNQSNLLRSILKSHTNQHSKYDLFIIKSIIEAPKRHIVLVDWVENTTEIMEFYKNRKDS